MSCERCKLDRTTNQQKRLDEMYHVLAGYRARWEILAEAAKATDHTCEMFRAPLGGD